MAPDGQPEQQPATVVNITSAALIELERLREELAAAEARVEALEAVVKLCVPLVAKALVIHHKKTKGEWDEVDGELEYWPIDDGCEANCPGCVMVPKKAAALDAAQAVLAETAGGAGDG